MGRMIIVAALLILAGCGGSSGGSKSQPEVPAPTRVLAEFDNGTVTISWASDAESHHIYYSTDPDMAVDNYAAHGGTWIQNASSPHKVTLDNPGPEHYFLVTALSGDRESRAATSGPVITRFSAIGDVVIDHVNGIEWQRCVVGQAWDGETCTGTATRMDHTVAAAYVGPDAEGWRLPTYDQLHSLVYCSTGDPVWFKPEAPFNCNRSDTPHIHPLFPNTPDYGTYTRPLIDHRGYVCGVSFGGGTIRGCAGEIKPGVPAGLAMIVRLSRDITN